MKLSAQILLLASLATLSSCGSFSKSVENAAITTRPVAIAQTAGFNATGLEGYQPVEMRTRIKEGAELSGIACEVQGTGFYATFKTPAIVMIPNYGQRNQDIVTYCRHNGQTISQIQHSRQRGSFKLSDIASGIGSAAAGPIGGALLGSITNFFTTERTSQFGYDNTTIIFEPPAESASTVRTTESR